MKQHRSFRQPHCSVATYKWTCTGPRERQPVLRDTADPLPGGQRRAGMVEH